MIWGQGRFGLSSLRGRLGAAAFAGLLTTGILTALLLLTANSANEVVSAASLSQDRSRVYLQLQSAATSYQHASFASVRDPGEETQTARTEERNRLENLLKEANRLPADDILEREASSRIARQVEALILHFDNSEQLVASVNQAWLESGPRASLEVANRISEPIYQLRDTLQTEITRGDGKVAEATNNTRSLITTAILASFIAIIMAIGFSLTVIALLQVRLRPGLRKLEKGAKSFAQGDFDHRISLGGRDELTQISNAFDTMAKSLGQKQNELLKVQLDLERIVASRTDQLRQANVKLSAADERRRTFYAQVSHELRTPLTIIRGEAQVALRTADHSDFAPQESFERILDQTQHLRRMVDDIFLIARAQAGGLPLQVEALDLNIIASRVAADFENLATERGGSICMIPGPLSIVAIDPERLKRAMAALIENALVHCQEGVDITIRVNSCDKSASISVCDNGPGIKSSQTTQLFERFERGATKAKGTGLGLSLVSALAEAHGGTADLAPNPKGGLCASMHFPLVTFSDKTVFNSDTLSTTADRPRAVHDMEHA